MPGTSVVQQDAIRRIPADLQPALRDILIPALHFLPPALANDPIFLQDFIQCCANHLKRMEMTRGSHATSSASPAPVVQSLTTVQGQPHPLPSSAIVQQQVQGQTLLDYQQPDSQEQLSSIQQHSPQPQSLSTQIHSSVQSINETKFEYQPAPVSIKSPHTAVSGTTESMCSLTTPQKSAALGRTDDSSTRKVLSITLCEFCFRGPHKAEDCHTLREVIRKLMLKDPFITPKDVYDAVIMNQPHPSKAIAAFLDNPAEFIPRPRRRKRLRPVPFSRDDHQLTSSPGDTFHGQDQDQLVSTVDDFTSHSRSSS